MPLSSKILTIWFTFPSSLSQVIDDQETAKLEYNQFLVLTGEQNCTF